MGWLWFLPLVNGVVGLLFVLFSRSRIEYIKLITSLIVTLLLWWVTMRFFRADLGMENFSDIFLLVLWISYAILSIGLDNLYHKYLSNKEIRIKYRILFPVVLILLVGGALLGIDKDVAFFSLVLTGVDLFVLTFIYDRFIVKQHIFLTALYLIPIAIANLFALSISGMMQINEAKYFGINVISVPLEHILVWVVMGLYTVVIYRSQYWDRKITIPKMLKSSKK